MLAKADQVGPPKQLSSTLRKPQEGQVELLPSQEQYKRQRGLEEDPYGTSIGERVQRPKRFQKRGIHEHQILHDIKRMKTTSKSNIR